MSLGLSACAKDEKSPVRDNAYCAWIGGTTYNYGNGQGVLKSDIFDCIDIYDKECSMVRWVNDPVVHATNCDGSIVTDGKGPE